MKDEEQKNLITDKQYEHDKDAAKKFLEVTHYSDISANYLKKFENTEVTLVPVLRREGRFDKLISTYTQVTVDDVIKRLNAEKKELHTERDKLVALLEESKNKKMSELNAFVEDYCDYLYTEMVNGHVTKEATLKLLRCFIQNIIEKNEELKICFPIFFEALADSNYNRFHQFNELKISSSLRFSFEDEEKLALVEECLRLKKENIKLQDRSSKLLTESSVVNKMDFLEEVTRTQNKINRENLNIVLETIKPLIDTEQNTKLYTIILKWLDSVKVYWIDSEDLADKLVSFYKNIELKILQEQYKYLKSQRYEERKILEELEKKEKNKIILSKLKSELKIIENQDTAAERSYLEDAVNIIITLIEQQNDLTNVNLDQVNNDSSTYLQYLESKRLTKIDNIHTLLKSIATIKEEENNNIPLTEEKESLATFLITFEEIKTTKNITLHKNIDQILVSIQPILESKFGEKIYQPILEWLKSFNNATAKEKMVYLLIENINNSVLEDIEKMYSLKLDKKSMEIKEARKLSKQNPNKTEYKRAFMLLKIERRNLKDYLFEDIINQIILISKQNLEVVEFNHNEQTELQVSEPKPTNSEVEYPNITRAEFLEQVELIKYSKGTLQNKNIDEIFSLVKPIIEMENSAILYQKVLDWLNTFNSTNGRMNMTKLLLEYFNTDDVKKLEIKYNKKILNTDIKVQKANKALKADPKNQDLKIDRNSNRKKLKEIKDKYLKDVTDKIKEEQLPF